MRQVVCPWQLIQLFRWWVCKAISFQFFEAARLQNIGYGRMDVTDLIEAINRDMASIKVELAGSRAIEAAMTRSRAARHCLYKA
jgi:hypothetical protein